MAHPLDDEGCRDQRPLCFLEESDRILARVLGERHRDEKQS